MALRMTHPLIEQMRSEYICDCRHLLGEHRFDGDRAEPCASCPCPHFHWSMETVSGPAPSESTEPRRGKLPFRKVWDRDEWTCVACGTHKDLTVDHIIPVSKGGTDGLDNLQTMCGTCNRSKGNRV